MSTAALIDISAHWPSPLPYLSSYAAADPSHHQIAAASRTDIDRAKNAIYAQYFACIASDLQQHLPMYIDRFRRHQSARLAPSLYGFWFIGNRARVSKAPTPLVPRHEVNVFCAGFKDIWFSDLDIVFPYRRIAVLNPNAAWPDLNSETAIFVASH